MKGKDTAPPYQKPTRLGFLLPGHPCGAHSVPFVFDFSPTLSVAKETVMQPWVGPVLQSKEINSLLRLEFREGSPVSGAGVEGGAGGQGMMEEGKEVGLLLA